MPEGDWLCPDCVKAQSALAIAKCEEGKQWELLECKVCSSADREESMILCDKCEQGYHLECLLPPLAVVPEGEWMCPVCLPVPVAAENLSLEGSANIECEVAESGGKSRKLGHGRDAGVEGGHRDSRGCKMVGSPPLRAQRASRSGESGKTAGGNAEVKQDTKVHGDASNEEDRVEAVQAKRADEEGAGENMNLEQEADMEEEEQLDDEEVVQPEDILRELRDTFGTGAGASLSGKKKRRKVRDAVGLGITLVDEMKLALMTKPFNKAAPRERLRASLLAALEVGVLGQLLVLDKNCLRVLQVGQKKYLE